MVLWWFLGFLKFKSKAKTTKRASKQGQCQRAGSGGSAVPGGGLSAQGRPLRLPVQGGGVEETDTSVLRRKSLQGSVTGVAHYPRPRGRVPSTQTQYLYRRELVGVSEVGCHPLTPRTSHLTSQFATCFRTPAPGVFTQGDPADCGPCGGSSAPGLRYSTEAAVPRIP